MRDRFIHLSDLSRDQYPAVKPPFSPGEVPLTQTPGLASRCSTWLAKGRVLPEVWGVLRHYEQGIHPWLSNFKFLQVFGNADRLSERITRVANGRFVAFGFVHVLSKMGEDKRTHTDALGHRADF